MENKKNTNIDVTEVDGIVIIHTSDVMDMEYSSSLLEFRKELFANGKYNIIFDLQNTDYINSTAMGSMMSYVKNLPKGGAIKLCNIRPHILEVLNMTRFDRLFGIYDTIDAARHSFVDNNK